LISLTSNPLSFISEMILILTDESQVIMSVSSFASMEIIPLISLILSGIFPFNSGIVISRRGLIFQCLLRLSTVSSAIILPLSIITTLSHRFCTSDNICEENIIVAPC